MARFGHHRAIVWNLGEENGWDDRHKSETGVYGLPNSHEQRRAFADYLKSVDPYDRPVVVHTLPGRFDDIYSQLLGHESLTMTMRYTHLSPGARRAAAKLLDAAPTRHHSGTANSS